MNQKISIRDERYVKLYLEMLQILDRSKLLRKRVDRHWENVLMWQEKYSDKKLNLLTEQESLGALREAEGLIDALDEGVKELNVLTKKYNALVDRINEYYEKEVLKKEPEYVHPYLDGLEVELEKDWK